MMNELHNLAQMRARELAVVYDRKRPNGDHCTKAYNEFEKLKVWAYSPTTELRARGYSKMEDVLQFWLTNAESHKEILSERLTRFAVALYIEEGRHYWIFLGYEGELERFVRKRAQCPCSVCLQKPSNL